VLHDLQQGKENQRQNLLETDERWRPTNATNKQELGETTTVAANRKTAATRINEILIKTP
jgi:hypothetical protein